MILSMSDQAASFLACIAAGTVLGNFYDFFRILRRVLRHKTAVTTIEDVIFWVAATLLMFDFLLHGNFDEIRGFTFLGVALGAVLYFLMISRFFIKFAMTALRRLKRTVDAIISPIIAMLRIIKKRLNSGRRYVKIKRRAVHQRIRNVKRRLGNAK